MTEKEKQNLWNTALMMTYFFVPYLGLRIAVENYLRDDDLGIAYSGLFGLIGGIGAAIYMTVFQTKTLKLKLVGLGIILLLAVLINLLAIMLRD